MVKVLFVCLGNICRSPSADGVLRKLLVDQDLIDRIEVDSCGTSDWHIGKAPDQRAQATASERGYDLSVLRARTVHIGDFEQFDFILAMDESNLKDLQDMAPLHLHGKIRLFLEYAPSSGLTAVPDPYYDGADGFEYVLDLVEEACDGLLEDIKQNTLK
jgi:low molecular weight protein-tyrosine phosphatase